MEDFQRLRPSLSKVAPGCLGIAVVTTICYPLHLEFAMPAFLYLLVVAIQSREAGFAASVLISLGAAACLDFFFTEPIFNMAIANRRDLIALLGYLVTSLIISRLASQARQEADTAERKSRALACLYETASRLLSIQPDSVSGPGTLRILHEVLPLQAVCLLDGKDGGPLIAGNAAALLARATADAYASGTDRQDVSLDVSVHCLKVAGKRVGAIGFQGLPDMEFLAGPLSALAAASLERGHALQAASAASAISQAEILRTAIVDAFAHQFKTPLAAILAAAGGIRETGPLDPRQLEMAGMIEEQALRLDRMTTRLLCTARLDQAAVQPRLEPTELGALIACVVAQCHAGEGAIFHHVNPSPIHVASDRELLGLAVAQLLDNALKYGQPDRAVEVRVEPDADAASVRVTNHGSGVSPGESERIFERFYRGATERRRAPGSGLGLYVARKIVHAHSGSLQLEQSGVNGEGTTFCLRLPLLVSPS